jgi:HAD superfamily hydrolase (TIGR01549 family)
MSRGLIFDLDGTLVDSQLDFGAMRREMQIDPCHDDLPILEAIDQLSPSHAAHCHQVLARHETEGARRAVPFPGVVDFLVELSGRDIRLAIVTRNCRSIAHQTLEKLPAKFNPVVTRESGPIKPDPWAVHHVCASWRLPPSQVAMIGDYRFDIECGKNAGAFTAFYSGGIPEHEVQADDRAGADVVISCFRRPEALWRWIESPIA